MTSYRTNQGDGLMVLPTKMGPRFPAYVTVMASFDDETIVSSIRPAKAVRLACSILSAAVQAVLIDWHVLQDPTE